MADLVTVGRAQGRLQVDSTSQISWQRYNGKYMPLNIGGTWQAKEIPAAGATMANTGLTQATLYYIYAYDNSTVLTLEATTSGWSFASTSGVPIKSTDETRTLLGMVYMDTGTPGLFRDTTQKRWCASYYNRSDRPMNGAFASAPTTASPGSWLELGTEIRLEMLTWADDAVELNMTGTAVNPTAGQSSSTGVAVDTVATALSATSHIPPGVHRTPHCIHVATHLGEGYHFVTLLGSISSGSATWATSDDITNGNCKVRLWGLLGAGQPDGIGGAQDFDVTVFDPGTFDTNTPAATGQSTRGGWFRTQFVPHTGMVVPRPVGVF